jgi:hypothetical protein
MRVITDNKYREIISFFDLSEKEQLEQKETYGKEHAEGSS